MLFQENRKKRYVSRGSTLLTTSTPRYKNCILGQQEGAGQTSSGYGLILCCASARKVSICKWAANRSLPYRHAKFRSEPSLFFSVGGVLFTTLPHKPRSCVGRELDMVKDVRLL